MQLKQNQHISQCPNSEQAHGDSPGLVSIRVIPSLQKLILLKDQDIFKEYVISTSANGLGEQKNSYKTPRGWHVVKAKIGANLPENAVFVKRRFTGEIYNVGLKNQFPDRDWILSRILWLSGLEPGFNRMGNVDTMQRYIYIHGTPNDVNVGLANSHGCIRMQNKDIIELFDLVMYGTKVYIEDV